MGFAHGHRGGVQDLDIETGSRADVGAVFNHHTEGVHNITSAVVGADSKGVVAVGDHAAGGVVARDGERAIA